MAGWLAASRLLEASIDNLDFLELACTSQSSRGPEGIIATGDAWKAGLLGALQQDLGSSLLYLSLIHI